MPIGEFGGGPEWPQPAQVQAQLPPSLLQMAQGIAPQMLDGGRFGGFGGGFDGAAADGFDQAGPYGANYPTNWQNDPAFFTWGNRGREFQAAVDKSYETGGRDQASTEFLAKTQRPKMASYYGADLPSTDDWQKLPSAYRRPGFALQNGHIIDTALARNPKAYLESLGIGPEDSGHFKMSEGVGIPYPLSLNDLSIGGQSAVWPGDVRGREGFLRPSYPTT